MAKFSLAEMFKENKMKRSILFILVFIIIYFVLATSLISQKYDLKVGDIAKIDIKAARDVVDQDSTDARNKQAVESVPEQYNKKNDVKISVISDINVFFTKAFQLKDLTTDNKTKLTQLKAVTNISLSDEVYVAILNLGKDDLKTLQDFLDTSLSDVYDNTNISDTALKNNQGDIQKAQDIILSKINESIMPKALKDLAVSIGYSKIKPNFFYDSEKTDELKSAAVRKNIPVMIKKDQIVVKEGEPVTKSQINILSNLGLLNSGDNIQWYLFASIGTLVLLILLLQWYFLYKYYYDIYNKMSMLVMINILNCIAIIIARTISTVSPFLIPLAFIPMVFTLLINYRVSIVISVLNTILISGAIGFNLEVTLLAVLNAVVGAAILKKMQQRNELIYSAFYIAVINVVLTLSNGFLLSNSTIDIWKKTLYIFIASILSGVFTIGVMPFFESCFGIVTTIKLLELSNPNHPLLKRLLLEASGTYHHSILVGNLAEVAADEVGGDPVLARVAAYYHDVGKLKRPYFFKENQITKENPHDKISPNLSTLIITSHVKDGVELAKQYKIPKILIDVIEQHHGTTLVKYFYVTMKNNSENPDEVNPEDFSYKGPIPESKEAGIIMLADGVEASVRSINEPTKGKIEEMINNIIKDRLNQGQLDNCDLTLRDINKIRQAFMKILMGIYHQRIEYPEDKWEKKQVKV